MPGGERTAMPISIILDVSTGLVFLFFLLALIASSLQELIAGIFAWRGTYLARAIDVILANDAKVAFTWYGIRDFLAAHFTTGPGQTGLKRLEARIQDPNRPQPKDADETKKMAQQDRILKNVLSIQSHPLLSNSPSTLPSYIPARSFALALIDILRDGSQAADLAPIRATIETLPEGDLKRILSLFLVNAGTDIDKFREKLEHWFDDAMARLSGIYTRLSHYMMLILGVVMALALNVDSIHVAQALWETPAMRAAAIASASNANIFANALPAPAPAPGGQTATPPATSAGATAEQPPNPPKPDATDDEVHQFRAAWTTVQELENEGLPFGWDFSKLTSVWSLTAIKSFLVANIKASTIPGWIVTAAAIAFGAPFWFGLLQNLANMRSSGPPPKPSSPTS
jgi:hypothetical protein